MRPFWTLPLDQLDAGEWEALCDGCGKCCFYPGAGGERRDDACPLLNRETNRCRDYANRRAAMGEGCLKITPEVARSRFMPETCAYRLRAEGRPLPASHPLRQRQ